MRTRRKFQVTVNVWEVCRWLRDAVLTYGISLEKPLLEFGGRSLQHYHNARMRGTRIERVTLPPSLVTVGISVFMEGKAADITGMEFFSEDGTSVSLGNKVLDAEMITEKEARSRLPYKTMQRSELDDDLGTFDPSHYNSGVQYLLDARSFRGFDFEGNSSGIHIIRLLREKEPSRAVGFMDTCEGTGRKYCCVIGMYNIIEVVGTFNVSATVSNLLMYASAFDKK
ncbi:Cytoplasmic GTPase/eEF2-like protein (ribosomal biogenesis) [Paecilomyces lecythidis]|uniref:Cytoplasmic GTPase/eEF2-like protein (Ribosomal biogenesis) n=1 Tax=Paecilomyces lecythidis TaxID=3004212 RepID=A0ABR3YGI5_9EURO